MSQYKPENWVILTCTSKGTTIDKIFSGSYGGYGGSDDWRLSSGLTDWEDKGDYIVATNLSGSVYELRKSAYGMSGYMRSMLHHWLQSIAESGDTKTYLGIREETFDK